MKRSDLWHRRGRVAAVALLVFAFCLTIATPGCGKKKSPSSSQGAFHQEGEEASGSAIRVAEPDREVPVVPAGRGVSVIIVPSSPSRITPPSVSVQSLPGQGRKITAVRWIVNGSERGSGEILSPSLFDRGDEIEAEVRLGSVNGETLIATEKVIAVNSLPAVTRVGIEPRALTAGSTVRAVVEAQDPDGDPLTFQYKWYVDNVQVPGDGETLRLRGVRKGSWVHVAVTPNDGFADGAWKFSPRYETVNAPPVVTSQAPTTIPPSRVLTHNIVAEDPDGDPLEYTLVKGTESMTLEGSMLTWRVSEEELGRTAEVVIRISDNNGGETVLTMNLTPKKP